MPTEQAKLTTQYSSNTPDLKINDVYPENDCYNFTQVQEQTNFCNSNMTNDQMAYYNANQQWQNQYENNYQFPQASYDPMQPMMNYGNNKCPPGFEYGYYDNTQAFENPRTSFYSNPEAQNTYADYSLQRKFNSTPSELDYSYMMYYNENQQSTYDTNATYYQAPRNQDRPEEDHPLYKTYFGSNDNKFSDDINCNEQSSTSGSRSNGDNHSSKDNKFKTQCYRVLDSMNVSDEEKIQKEQKDFEVEHYLKMGDNDFSQTATYEDDKTLEKAFAQSDSIFLGF